MKEKIRRVPQVNEKASQIQTLQQKSHQRDQHLDCPPCKMLKTIHKMDKERTSINGPEDKKANDNA